jgi:hypothetical protein
MKRFRSQARWPTTEKFARDSLQYFSATARFVPRGPMSSQRLQALSPAF